MCRVRVNFHAGLIRVRARGKMPLECGSTWRKVRDMLKNDNKINELQSLVVTAMICVGALFLGTGIYFGVREIEQPRLATQLPGFRGGNDLVIARVNGQEIRLSDVVMARSELPPEAAGLPDALVLEAVINELIDRRLFAEAGWKAGLTRDGVMQGRLRFEQEKLLRDQYIAGMIETTISERDIKQLYEARYLDEDRLREAHLWQILVRTREEAEEVLQRYQNGDLFDDLARQYSLDSFAVVGGDMGYQSVDALLPEVSDRAFSMAENEVSLPFTSRFGWHVIWLEDVRFRKPPALITVHNELKHELIEDALYRDLAKLRAGARIERVELPHKAELDRALVASQ